MAVPKEDTTRMLLITANVATCFEQSSVMLRNYMDELLKGVQQSVPGVFALHCQEVGGKNYQNPTNTSQQFIETLFSRSELEDYTRSIIYLDEATSAPHQFTALGNLYFFHKDVGQVETWNFKENKYEPVEGRKQFTGVIEDVPTKEKAKFPQEFFPKCKWSRKGFMRTRWNINGTQLDFINIHLFHDASNLLAMEEFPSVYTLNRRRALHHTLDRFHNDNLENVPFFMFGDFNFRLDTKSVVELLTKDCTSSTDSSSKSKERSYFQKDDNALDKKSSEEPELRVSERFFRHSRHQSIFKEGDADWLRKYDLESQSFAPRLCEMAISFPPSYPFEEEAKKGDAGDSAEDVIGNHYAYTRLPGWCDRIMISTAARELMAQTEHLGITYQLLGLETPMGDHKPVSLLYHIPKSKGIVPCCAPDPCPPFVHNPKLGRACFTPSNMWCICQHYRTCPSATPKTQSTAIPSQSSTDPKPPKIAKIQDSPTLVVSVPTIVTPVIDCEPFNSTEAGGYSSPGTSSECGLSTTNMRRFSELAVDFNERRVSLLSDDALDIQCACSSDEMSTSRRCSQASFTDSGMTSFGGGNKHWHATSSIRSMSITSSCLGGDFDVQNERKRSDSLEVQLDVSDACDKLDESHELKSSGSEQVSGAGLETAVSVASNTKELEATVAAANDSVSQDASIMSADSEGVPAGDSVLSGNDTLTTLLKNRVKKYDGCSSVQSTSEAVDRVILTSSLRVENGSVVEDDTATIDETTKLLGNEDKQSHSEASAYYTDAPSLDDPSKDDSRSNKTANGECDSITLSTDITDDVNDDTSSKTSKDIYSKLEQLRKSKKLTEPQQSLNNLLVSDSGSEQMSVRQRSESSLSGVCSEDTMSKSSRRTKDYESVSQMYSEDSTSVKSRPLKDFESISQTPTTDIADLEGSAGDTRGKQQDNNIEPNNKKKKKGKCKTLSLRKRKNSKSNRLTSSLRGSDGTNNSVGSTTSSASTTPTSLQYCNVDYSSGPLSCS